MAKKVVATLQGGAGSKKMTKVIKMVRSEKSGAYIFDEKVMNADEVNDYLKKLQMMKDTTMLNGCVHIPLNKTRFNDGQ